MLGISKNKNIDKGNKLATLFTIAISSFLVVFYSLSLVYIVKYNIVSNIRPEDFIRFFNVVLALLASISCVLCYKSTEKEELFIISLMYIVFGVDISLGIFDNLILKNTIINMKGYIAISTSLMRIAIILIATFPLNKIRKIIMDNKLYSIFIIIICSVIFGTLEKLNIVFNADKQSSFLISYNIILVFIYSITSAILFIKSIKNKDYIYSVIGASILLFLVKAVYAIVGARIPIIGIKFISISITYITFILLIIGLFLETNINTRKKKELEEERRIFFDLVEENKSNCILISNMNGDIIYSNKKTKEYLLNHDRYNNLSLNEKVSLVVSTIDEDTINSIKQGINENGCWSGKINIAYGENILDCVIQRIDDTKFNLTDLNEEKAKLVVSFTDITEKQRTKKYIAEYEKIKEHEKLKNEFFANISHELRTPLNIFYSTVQLLDVNVERDCSFKDEYLKYRHSLKINCQRMLRLINNMVDITKIDVGYTKPSFKNYDIIRLVEEITMSVVTYAKQKNINIIFDTNTEENIIKCDPEMIERAILNLLSNAIKFTKENGNIFVNIYVNKEWVQITVTDDGIGIPIHMQDLVFERFVQADKSLTRMNEGSGIGLSIVKAMVELNEGEIYLESDKDCGSEFEILLPNKKLLGDDMFEVSDEYEIDPQKIELELSDIYELY